MEWQLGKTANLNLKHNMTDLKEILKECVKLNNSGKSFEAFKRWEGVLASEIEANSYEEQ